MQNDRVLLSGTSTPRIFICIVNKTYVIMPSIDPTQLTMYDIDCYAIYIKDLCEPQHSPVSFSPTWVKSDDFILRLHAK